MAFGETAITRDIYLNAVLPALIVLVGFGAAWFQGQEVKRMDQARRRHGTSTGTAQNPAE